MTGSLFFAYTDAGFARLTVVEDVDQQAATIL